MLKMIEMEQIKKVSKEVHYCDFCGKEIFNCDSWSHTNYSADSIMFSIRVDTVYTNDSEFITEIELCEDCWHNKLKQYIKKNITEEKEKCLGQI